MTRRKKAKGLESERSTGPTPRLLLISFSLLDAMSKPSVRQRRAWHRTLFVYLSPMCSIVTSVGPGPEDATLGSEVVGLAGN